MALSLAARRPRLVRRLVLVAPAGLQPRSRVPPMLLGPGAERLFELRRRLAPLTDLPWGRRLLLHAVIAAHAAPGERARLAEPGERLAAGSSFLDATSYGVGGMIEDYLTYSRGWCFDPEEVEPEVHVWHGGVDPLVPVEHALQLAVALPSCRIFVDPDEGHHFFRRRLEEILTVLITPDRGPLALSRAGARALLRCGMAR